MAKNYYLSSFFWSTAAKILNALFSFITIPLLLGHFGKSEYGILSIATACNGYMALLDLGMNTGAVKFFSQWKAEGKTSLRDRVARTNITFYLIISIVNITGLIAIALWGKNFFAVTDTEFEKLRTCLFIIATFAPLSWVTTAFNQLLIADKQIGFTMQIQCFQTILKTALVGIILFADSTMTTYFLYFTLITASLIFPYAYKCLKDNLISTLRPAKYWSDFKIVFTFSLSIFALSFFQVTALQSRPIILSIFTDNATNVVTDFKIIEVIPLFIITIGGTFSSIFLPRTSELVAQRKQKEIEEFAYNWTFKTSIIANILCIPFILSAQEAITAYVGKEFSHLSTWLSLWCLTVLIQIHTTPGNSLVLAYGKTKALVITTAISCAISMIINIILCKQYGIGSAIIGYFVYVNIIIGLYYIIYYKKLMGLNRIKMFTSFMYPTLISLAIFAIVYFIPTPNVFNLISNTRIKYIVICIFKTAIWILPYLAILTKMNKISIKEIIYSRK